MAEQVILRQFIEILKEMTCLWQVKSPDYQNKHKRTAAKEMLLSVYKEIKPDATIKDVQEKITNMRTAWKREHAKVVKTEVSGAGADEVYKPQLWYYHDLNFLAEENTTWRPVISADDGELSFQETDSPCSSRRPSVDTTIESAAKKKKLTPLDAIAAVLAAPPAVEEFQGYGAYVAEGLRKMPRRQALLAQNLITQVISAGQLGEITRESNISGLVEAEYLD